MNPGYRTADGIDLNDLWYGGAGVQAAVDTYRTVTLPIVDAMAMMWGTTIIKYGLSEFNGFQLLGPGERPRRKIVAEAAIYPDYNKHGYGVSTDIDTLRLARAQQIINDMGRPIKEDPQFVLTKYLKAMMVDPGSNNVLGGLYNGQFAAEEKLTAPPSYQQQTFLSAHSHFMGANTGNTFALADIHKMVADIRHHGNNGPVIGLINSATVQVLSDQASFDNASIIRSPISDMVAVMGFSDVFQLGGVVWHVTEMVPGKYVLVTEINQSPEERPLIHFEPEAMKGLNVFPGTPGASYPLIDSFWERWIGVKVAPWGRGKAVALYYGATSWTDPTFRE
jgi:hypothetical protein